MAQEFAWENEYKNSKLLTKENKPQSDVVKFAKWLKKEGLNFEDLNILDLGSGTGRNSFYFSELGSKVSGLEISKTAIDIAKAHAEKAGLSIEYKKQSIGEGFPFENGLFDVVLDVTSSNSLTEMEREVFLHETNRVLKKDGYFFVKALCKDGDDNAKNLLKQFPGKEKDTYIMPDIGITEKVWSKEDFLETYQKFFKVIHLEKKSSYTRMNQRSYKRNFWICYLNGND
jgi:SAM-dependent methyltransferase